MIMTVKLVVEDKDKDKETKRQKDKKTTRQKKCFAPHGSTHCSGEDCDDDYDSATLCDCILTTAEQRLLKPKFANSFRQLDAVW